MSREERISSLLKGAIDLHIHADPSFMKRSCDIVEAAEECCRAGMLGIGVKDHHVSTALGAYFANKYMHRYGGNPFTVYGSICLNNAVGFNPRAVDAALKLGAKIVYLPTVAAPAHIKLLSPKSGDSHFIPQKIKAKQEEPMPILDDNGELLPAVAEIIDVIKESDALLATGHIDYDEAIAVVKYAKKIGLEKVSLTHLSHFTTRDLKALDKIVDIGGIVEVNLCLLTPETPEGCRLTKDEFIEQIRHFGVERCSFCSDAGSVVVPRPVDHLSEGIGMLIDYGFTDDEIRTMASVNPKKLIGYTE